MFISKIILNGFKSFANKTVIDINENMFVSIVGPNGSGKSNILDAMKWIMGENSSIQMRYSTSTDVLFAGTKTTAAKNICEVEIIFNNENKKHSLPNIEISIKRRLTKNGENTYFINNNKVRQKDIVDFFLEIGVSKSSLLMINQGKIDSFINMSSNERAKLIEQVAQVSIFEDRKKKSLSKLDRSNENLNRLSDILKEKESTFNILEKSAKKAIKYKNISEKLNEHIYLRLNTQLNLKNKSLKDNIKVIGVLNQEKNNLIVKYEKSAIILDNYKNILKENKYEEREINESIISLSKKKEKMKYESKESLLVSKSQLDTLLLKKTELHTEVKNIEERNNVFRNKLSEIELNHNKTYQNIYEIKKELDNCQSKQLLYRDKYETIQKTLINNENDLKNINNSLVYKDIEKLKDLNFYKIDDVVVFNDKYENIIYDFLGNITNNIITKTSDEAKEILNVVNKNKLSRVSIIPLDSIKEKKVNKNIEKLRLEKGFIETFDKLCVFDKNFERLSNYLFSNIILIDNIDNATVINNKYKNYFTFVTLNLEYIYPSGIFSGGYNRNSKSNKIIYRNSILKNIEKSKKELSNIEITIDKNNKKINELSNANILTTKLISKLESQKENIIESLNYWESELENKTILYNNTDSKISKIEHLKNDVNIMEINELTKNINDFQTRKENIINRIYKYENNIEDIISKLTKWKSDITSYDYEIINKENEINSLKEQISKLDEEIKVFPSDFVIQISNYDDKIIKKYKAELRLIGSVDYDVIEDFENISKEIVEYKKDILDIGNSIDNIRKAIKDLEKLSSERFNKFFDKIVINFKRYFKYIFPDGYCDLDLIYKNDIRSIDVIASTKGTTHNLISLLSGGEKALTIICLLFSILNVSNFSFIILDEIEAALDETNVDKIANILSDFSKTTQIITITHRRGTMKKSDILYGISHGEIGISQAIKLELGV